MRFQGILQVAASPGSCPLQHSVGSRKTPPRVLKGIPVHLDRATQRAARAARRLAATALAPPAPHNFAHVVNALKELERLQRMPG